MRNRNMVDLPLEVLVRVVRILSPYDRTSLLLTCRRLQMVCNSRLPATLTSLPVELLVRIVRMFPVRQRFRLMLSCKWMQSVIRSNLIGFRVTRMNLRHLRTLSSGSRAEDEFVLQKSTSDLFWSRYE